MPLKWKWILIAAVAVLSALSAWPPQERIKLGLDLKGGIHLLTEVDTAEALKAELDDAAGQLLERFKELEITHSGVQVEFEPADGLYRVVVRGIAGDQLERARKAANDRLAGLDVSELPDGIVAELPGLVREQVSDTTVEQALNTIRERIDAYGVVEPVLQRQGRRGERILIQLPGVDDPERVKKLIGKVAFLELKLVENGPYPTVEAAASALGGTVPPNLELVEEIAEDGGSVWYALQRIPIVTGRDLSRADVITDEYGLPAVGFGLNAEGARKFGDFTGANVGRQLAIVLDNTIKSAPVIRSRIGASGQIEGSFTADEARDLALVLRAGALPAKIDYLEERTVGPSLGRDSIRRGVFAALAGLVVVVIFMLIYYRLSGINAVVALLLNMLIMAGALSALGATLTLPGIAGFILTIGMAVDANVIIFERIREELRGGKNVRQAIDGGFAKAFMTIFDANITTLIAALLLIQFGTGPVRGFAVTLSIGIVASMFTAIFVSKSIFEALFFGPGRSTSKFSI